MLFHKHQRKFHILKCAEYRNQIECLENKTDIEKSQIGKFVILKVGDVFTERPDFAIRWPMGLWSILFTETLKKDC